jgi:CDP-diacylglycerol--glycerol-3-phosphate 3-phosphatidyltransferase
VKPWYTRRLRRFVDLAVARRISPDVFTVLGVAAAALAAVCVGQGWWFGALVALAPAGRGQPRRCGGQGA